MKELIKKFLPQRLINIFYHLPKAILANIYYGSPAKGGGMKIIGITGTDGKTTTTNMVYQILKAAGRKVSMVSTINAPGLHVTSPDPFIVQQFVKSAKKNGDEYLVLEVTSHALDQYRFWGINFDVGVITNVTPEHLDYHKTFKNYLQTKMRLLNRVRSAVVNRNLKKDVEAMVLAPKELLTFGFSSGDFNQSRIKLNLKVNGDYNIENALCALAVAFALGIDRKIAQKVLEQFSGLTGRMEQISNNKGLDIYVDFAHTPNALEQALKTLRSYSKSGKLIAVFGSAGKRDIQKRFVMGQIAGKMADLAVITAEDPRGELEIINKKITEGAKKAGKVLGKNLYIVDDRGQAIDFAINKAAKKGDTIGIFGKGHEKSMNLDGKKEIPWSDQEAVKLALGSLSEPVKI